MKAKEFFEMSSEELNTKLAELKTELFNLRFKHAIKQLSNPLTLVEVRRNIARVKTVLRQRELGIVVEPAVAAKKKSRLGKKA